MSPLAKLLQEQINKAPIGKKSDNSDYSMFKQTGFLLDAIKEAGFELQAHQQGIGGTYLCFKPIQSK